MFTFSLNRSIGVLGSYLIYRSLYQGYSYIRIGGKLLSTPSRSTSFSCHCIPPSPASLLLKGEERALPLRAGSGCNPACQGQGFMGGDWVIGRRRLQAGLQP